VTVRDPTQGQGALDLSFVRRGGKTVVDRKRFRWPFVLTQSFVLDGDPPDMRSVILQSSSGALHGQDRLRVNIETGPEARAYVTTQAATAVHRADSSVSVEETRLTVAEGGHLEYIPDPRILLPGAALQQTVVLDCDARATALLTDSFTRHVPGGAMARHVYYRSEVILKASGRTVAVDRQVLPPVDGPCFHGTLYLMGALGPEALGALSAALSRQIATTDGLYGAASLLPADSGLTLRLVAQNGEALRRGLDTGWRMARAALIGEAPSRRRTDDSYTPDSKDRATDPSAASAKPAAPIQRRSVA